LNLKKKTNATQWQDIFSNAGRKMFQIHKRGDLMALPLHKID